MKYLFLIHDDESKADLSPEAMAPWDTFGNEVAAAGVIVEGGALQPTSTATCVRIDHDNVITTDGPFAETKEQMGGYYILDVKDLDEAKAWAAKIPAAKDGGIEIRQVMSVFDDPSAG